MDDSGTAGLVKWTIVGTALQLLMVISGHYNEFIALNVFAIGGMSISLLVGAAYGVTSATSRANGVTGGILVGGTCALIGVAVSVGLGDTQVLILAIGTVSSAVTGGIGGLGASFFRVSASPST